jgi:ketosteroid isomerase-like protein
MKKFLVLFILLAACNPRHENVELQKQMLMKTDMDFCQMALDKGVKDAFIFYAADDVVMMRDGALPLFGKPDMIKNFGNNSRNGVQLRWIPVKADVSGDIGYTFGKWEMKIPGKDTTWYGSYVTVWKKQEDGSWKYVLDGGNSTPKP